VSDSSLDEFELVVTMAESFICPFQESEFSFGSYQVFLVSFPKHEKTLMFLVLFLLEGEITVFYKRKNKISNNVNTK